MYLKLLFKQIWFHETRVILAEKMSNNKLVIPASNAYFALRRLIYHNPYRYEFLQYMTIAEILKSKI